MVNDVIETVAATEDRDAALATDAETAACGITHLGSRARALIEAVASYHLGVIHDTLPLHQIRQGPLPRLGQQVPVDLRRLR